MIRIADPATRVRPLPFWIAGAAVVCLAGVSVAHEGAAPAFERASAVLAIGCLLIVAGHVDPAWLGAAALALTPLSGNWTSLGIQVPLDRLLLALAAIVALTRHLRSPEPRARILRPVHVLLMAAALCAVVSAIWAGTLGDHDTRFALLDRYGLVPFAMFILAPIIFPGARERAVLLGTLVPTGAYLGLTAFFETFGVDALVWPRYIVDSSVGLHEDRARGPFVEAAANGLGLYACGVAAAVALVIWRRPVARVGAAAVMLLCAAGLLFTLTRSIWLGSVVATAVALLASRQLRRHLVPATIAVVVGVAAMFAFVPSFADRARERQAAQRTVWDRENLNAAGFRMVGDRPLTGFGYGNGRSESLEFVRQADDFPLAGSEVKIHNAYLSLAVELGMLGALIWGVAFASTVGVAALRRAPPGLEPWRLALIAIAAQGLVVQNLVPGSFVFPILVTWTLAGLIAGASSNHAARGVDR